jgi:hypothetical protein
VAWAQAAQFAASARNLEQLLTPAVARSLSLPPAQRTGEHIAAVRRLLHGLPIVQDMPEEVMALFCRFCAHEVLHDDMVLPRSPRDLETAFVVLSGAVRVVYGELGEYVLAASQQRSPAARVPLCAPSDASSPLRHQVDGDVDEEQLAAVCTAHVASRSSSRRILIIPGRT